MAMIPLRLMIVVFLLAALGYVGVSRVLFEMPVSLEQAEASGFTSAEFTPTGVLSYAPTQAWWLSFGRKAEYWTALSIGLAASFMAFALAAMRRIGGASASGAVAGGGLLALAALCMSCIAPALSIVGLGVFAGFLAGIPKWLIALNTLILTAWGTLFLSRRLRACPVSPAALSTPTKAIR